MLEFGITSPEAERLLRTVCIHQTAKAHTSTGRRLNLSSVSVKTGVNRKVVKAALKNPPHVGEGLDARRDTMRRVIDGWLSDPDYSRSGRPKDLDVGGPGSEGRDAWSLVQRYAPGVWPRLIIDELLRVDYVKIQPNGRLKWQGVSKGAVALRPRISEEIGSYMRDAIRAAFNDLIGMPKGRCWRATQSFQIGRGSLHLVHKMLADRFDTMIRWVRDELNSARWKEPSKAGAMRVGLAGFTFEEPAPAIPDLKNANTRRVRRVRSTKESS
jgi:hypothetical protein